MPLNTEVHKENLLWSVHNLTLRDRFTFQQDNNSTYTARIELEWLWEKAD